MSSEFALGAIRGVAAVTPRGQSAPGAAKAPKPASSPVVKRSDALDPGPPPIDHDRVAEVRRAIERGNYPIVPAKVADAIIAAGILLRTGG